MAERKHAVVYSFSSYKEAEQAYLELREDGFAETEVDIRTFDDEAGPVSGNFILEYKDSDQGQDNSALDKLTTNDDPNEGQGRQAVAWHTVALVAVSVDKSDRVEKLAQLKKRWGKGVT